MQDSNRISGSLLPDPQVRAEVALCGPIQANLDGANDPGSPRLARPHRETSLGDRIEGYKALKAELDGQCFWLHGVFVAGADDMPEPLDAWISALRDRVRSLHRTRCAANG